MVLDKELTQSLNYSDAVPGRIDAEIEGFLCKAQDTANGVAHDGTEDAIGNHILSANSASNTTIDTTDDAANNAAGSTGTRGLVCDQ